MYGAIESWLVAALVAGSVFVVVRAAWRGIRDAGRDDAGACGGCGGCGKGTSSCAPARPPR